MSCSNYILVILGHADKGVSNVQRTATVKTLSVNYYFYILKILESLGLERDDITHILPSELESSPHPSIRIDIDALSDLFHVAQNKLKDPHIGLHVSENFRISNYGYAGNIFSICETLSQAISMTEKYGCLAHTLGSFRHLPNSSIKSEFAKYIWSPSYPPSEDEKYKHITECVLGNYGLTIGWLGWSLDRSVEKICFRHAAAKSATEYRRILKCDIEFGADENSIFIAKDSLHKPLPTANPMKVALLQQMLNQKLAAYNMETDLTGRVTYVLHEMIKLERPTLLKVSEKLSISERTFKRYLKDKETSFQSILRSVKMELCSDYIKEGLPLSEIAQALWYYDQSALTRAYKKWHGVSPTQRAKGTKNA